MKLLKQKTLRDSNEIFNELTEIISHSRKRIEVVSAWFTDPDLLDLLIQKQLSGVNISVIISDQKQNNKLPFEQLINNGGEVRRVKKTGYGMMHQKFCIVDDEILVHGSYNWTINARKNNDESVIITNHEETVKEMSEIFKQLKNNSKPSDEKKDNLFKRILSGLSSTIKIEKDASQLIDQKELDVKEKIHVFNDLSRGYKDILEQLMESKISDFDKDRLQSSGFDKGLACDGNTDMLNNHLDAVYADFLGDVALGDDELKHLISKVEVVRANAIAQKEQYRTLQQSSVERVYDNKLNEMLQELDRLNKALEIKLSRSQSIENNKSSIVQKIEILKERLGDLNMNYKPLKVKRYELFTFAFLSVISLVAIVLFYGSALYIMRYSLEDATVALDSGIILRPPGIFDDQAFSKAMAKGMVSIILLSVFFIVPVGLALFRLYTRSNNAKLSSFLALIGILSVDTFIAARISKNIHEVNYLKGDITGPWKVTELIFDLNFYSVFIIGCLVVLLFEFFISKVKTYYDNKNGDVDAQMLQLEKGQIKDKIQNFNSELDACNAELIQNQSEINQNEIEIKSTQRYMDQIPNEKERELKTNELLVNSELNTINENCDLVLTTLESGSMPYSFDSLKERVSIFLNGWNDFLHSHYANKVANQKTQDMNQEKEKWISEKSHLLTFKKVA